MMTAALEVVGVGKRYEGRVVLADVGLAVSAGELHGVLGPNGAGKTTLLRIILGLVRPDGGSVRLLGQSLDARQGRIPERVAGFVEAPAFYPYLSARQNLILLATLDGQPGTAAASDAAHALERVGLATAGDDAVRGYSTGMRQRLGIAAASLRRPRLLFLDEPTSAVDPASARQVRGLIREMADEGVAIVFSSHDMNEVEELSTSLTILNDGRVVFSDRIEQLRARTPGPVCVLRTSDDTSAVTIASRCRDVLVVRAADAIEVVAAGAAAMDQYVIALARAGVAVRELQRRERSLESFFLDLTAGHGRDAIHAVAQAPAGRSRVQEMSS